MCGQLNIRFLFSLPSYAMVFSLFCAQFLALEIYGIDGLVRWFYRSYVEKESLGVTQ